MAVTLTTVLPEQAQEVGTLVHEAFLDIAERHNFPPAYATPQIPSLVIRLIAQTEGWESYLLTEGDRPIACNFGDERDEIVGVGPVAVAVDQQGRGLGRRVMEALLERADERGFRSVRLIQSAYNMQSFSLYHKLGFNVTEALALVQGRPPEDASPHGTTRDYGAADVDACDRLHHEVMGYGRRNDLEAMARFAPPVVIERDGAVAGYLTRFPGEEVTVTHGVARDEQALRDLIIGTARAASEQLVLFIPTSQAATLRWALANGFRLRELNTYMVRGEYEPPSGAWIPAGFY